MVEPIVKREEKEVEEIDEMKRQSEMEKRSTELRSAIEELSMLPKVHQSGHNPDAAQLPTKSFLLVCTLILQVLG